ncbi:MAG: hypothetical protein JNJ63_07805 [Hyphomonadaceae bacterium]|nr:hypothetical protein [Hyphomonadaceae bacterium]
MSLNKTLDRLFDEIRREAKRNPDFADRLDAVLRLHDSRREVADELVEEVAREEEPFVSSPARGGGGERQRAGGGKSAKRAPTPPQSAAPTAPPQAGEQTTALNPAGLFKREGEDALTAALAALDESALRALVVEHNLDPAGEAEAMNEAELAAHIVAQAKRRAERDDKMFDY